MKEHIQECPVNGMTIHMTDLDHYYGRYQCQCEILRACEQRVMSQFVDGIELVSYRKGLDAAREAVRGIASDDLCCMCPTDEGLTLAAIDALREVSE